MSNLTLINHQGQYTIDSREVAEMVEVRHSDLLEKIGGYITHLTNGNFRSLDFFIPSGYKDAKGETRPCYLLTRKGCDMVANKLTGEKGVLFTAAYVTKFEEMEKAQKKPATILEALAQTVQVLQEQESRIKQLEGTTQAIKDTIIQEPDNWREDINRMFNKIVDRIGGQKFQEIRNESYKLLEQRAHVDLNRRLMNLRTRMLDQGFTKTAIEKANRMDVIEQDPKLREIYSQIIKEYYIRYVA